MLQRSFHEKLRHRLLRASAITTITRVVNQAFGIINVGLLARYMDLNTLGVYFIIRNMAAMVVLFCNFGAVQAAQKFLGEVYYTRPSLLAPIKNRLRIVNMTTTVIVLLAYALLWEFLTNHVFSSKAIEPLLLYSLAYIFIDVVQMLQSAYLRAIDRMLLSGLALNTITRILFFFGLSSMVIFQIHDFSIKTVLSIWLLAGTINAIIGAVFVWKAFKPYKIDDDKKEAPTFMEIWRLSIPFGVVNVTNQIRNSLSVLIVGAVLGPSAAGIYGPIKTFSRLVAFVLESISLSLAAVVSGIQNQPKKLMSSICREAASMGVIAGVPIALVFLLAGDLILRLALGNKFDGYGLLLFIVCLGPLSKAICGSPNVILQMTGYQRSAMKVNLAGTIISVGGVYLCAKSLGIYGAGTAYSLSMVGQFIFLAFMVEKHLQIKCYAGPFTRYHLARYIKNAGNIFIKKNKED